MNYLDSHCHINDESYENDFDEMLDRMLQNRVNKALVVSCKPEEFEKSVNFKKEGIDFKYSLGVYPSDAFNMSEERYEEYLKYIKDDRCIAVGEIGLDYHYDKEHKNEQIAMFNRQLTLAEQLNKPVIIHSRDAVQDTYDILKKHHVRGVIHCYSDSKEMAKEFVKLGFYISISGTVTFKNAREPLEVIKEVPLDRLLIETDCPYLTPVPHRGKRNEPSYVVHTAKRIMDELNIDEKTFLSQINKNYEELFGR